MDNRRNDRNRKSNFLTGMFEIPAWLLLLIAVVAILATVLRITLPAFLWILVVLVLIVIGWIRAQPNPTSGRTVELSDEDAPQYKLRFSGLPENVNPRILKIEDREKLKNLQKDKEVGEVLSVAADFAFYDNNDRLVSSFATPVKLTLNYTDQDKRGLNERTQKLRREGRLAENEEAILIPVYLYSPVFKTQQNGKETRENEIWMPFQKFTRDDVNQTLTVEFMFWGDQQGGFGTQP
jgi:hypothetical protein